MKKFALGFLLPVLAVVSSTVPVKAADPNLIVPYLEVQVQTGGDDLRSGAVAYGQIQLKDGRTLPQFNLNRGQQWKNNSNRTIKVPAGVRLGDLQSFTLSHDGAPRNVFESYDNWNVDRFTITTPQLCMPGVSLADQSGRPLVRLTGKQTFQDIRLQVTAAHQNRSTSAINVTFKTGADDLRSGAVAYGTIRLRNGRTLPTVNLNRGRRWTNNSTQTVTMSLPSGIKLGDLANLRVQHDGAPRNALETYDNWNIDRVSVGLPSQCSPGITLTKPAIGHPFVRFTGSNTAQMFRLQPQ